MTFWYASHPVNCCSLGTATLSPSFARFFRLSARRSGKTSPTTTRRTPGAEASTLPIAPVPRPPQPITPTRISSLPAANAPGMLTVEASVPPTTAAVVVRKKSRREDPPSVSSWLLIGLLHHKQKIQGFTTGVSFGFADHAEADKR